MIRLRDPERATHFICKRCAFGPIPLKV